MCSLSKYKGLVLSKAYSSPIYDVVILAPFLLYQYIAIYISWHSD
jgi:hypothetical protein